MEMQEKRRMLSRRGFAAAGAATALAAGMPAAEAVAQDTPAIVGAWRVDSRLADQSRAVRWVVAADGTVSGTVPATMPGFPGMAPLLFVSGVSGVWTADGATGGAFTYDMQVSDDTGAVMGYFTIAGTFEVAADGQTIAGPYSTTFTDPTGAAMPLGVGDFSGTRMVVEPMAAPAATPAS